MKLPVLLTKVATFQSGCQLTSTAIDQENISRFLFRSFENDL